MHEMAMTGEKAWRCSKLRYSVSTRSSNGWPPAMSQPHSWLSLLHGSINYYVHWISQSQILTAYQTQICSPFAMAEDGHANRGCFQWLPLRICFLLFSSCSHILGAPLLSFRLLPNFGFLFSWGLSNFSKLNRNHTTTFYRLSNS